MWRVFAPTFSSAPWTGLLQRQTAEARQILRKLLVGRLVFTPREDEEGKYYEFAGKGSISEVITGVVLPKVWWPQPATPDVDAMVLLRSGPRQGA